MIMMMRVPGTGLWKTILPSFLSWRMDCQTRHLGLLTSYLLLRLRAFLQHFPLPRLLPLGSQLDLLLHHLLQLLHVPDSLADLLLPLKNYRCLPLKN